MRHNVHLPRLWWAEGYAAALLLQWSPVAASRVSDNEEVTFDESTYEKSYIQELTIAAFGHPSILEKRQVRILRDRVRHSLCVLCSRVRDREGCPVVMKISAITQEYSAWEPPYYMNGSKSPVWKPLIRFSAHAWIYKWKEFLDWLNLLITNKNVTSVRKL